MSEENGGGAGRRGYGRLRDAPDGVRGNEPLRVIRSCGSSRPTTIAREQRAKRGMHVAQLGLRRGLAIPMMACGARAILMPVRGEMVAKVPDPMGERALLCAQQQYGADGVK